MISLGVGDVQSIAIKPLAACRLLCLRFELGFRFKGSLAAMALWIDQGSPRPLHLEVPYHRMKSDTSTQEWLNRCGPLMDMVRVAQNALKLGTWLSIIILTAVTLFAAVAGGSQGGIMALALLIALAAALLSTHGFTLMFQEKSGRQDLCLFLRAFRTDRSAEMLRAWLKGALGSDFRFSGIRPPRERTRKWLSFLYPMLTGMRYVGAAQFQLEAPDRNWMARLLCTFNESRFVFIDVRDITTHVHDEILLAWTVFGAERILFIVDDQKTPEAWRAEVGQILGTNVADADMQKMRQLVWPAGREPDKAAFTQAVRSFVASLPEGAPAIAMKSLAFARAHVPDTAWPSRPLERERPFLVLGVVSSLALGFIPLGVFDHVRAIGGVIIGLMFQVSCFVAWRRARRQNKLAQTLYAQGAVSSWRLWKALACMLVLPAVSIVAALAALAVPSFTNVQNKALDMKAMSQARQIMVSLKQYAADNNGQYPDASPDPVGTSNQAFRRLFKEGILYDEAIFGPSKSPLGPDGNIGAAPEFEQAVTPGENIWAMTADLRDDSSGTIPLVYDAPIQNTWPPAWAEPTSEHKLGEARPGRRIVVIHNDGFGTVETLVRQPGTGLLVPANSASWNTEGPHRVLNAEPRP